MEITILRKVLEKNDNAARETRARFDACDVKCFNLLGGAGCGKTTILEMMLPRLAADGLHCAVLEGDLATTRDAERIAALGVPVIQLLTDGGCHLTATHVQKAAECLPLDELDVVFIENVGNPICPANFDLGEHRRISALSVAEGDDKPLKYPLLFRRADVVLITKCDLLPYACFDLERACAGIRRLCPDGEIIQTDDKTQSGIVRLASWIHRQCRMATAASV